MINRYRSSCREMVMFADDINALITDKDACALQIKIDRLMTELEIWFNRNDLIINIEKNRNYVISQ